MEKTSIKNILIVGVGGQGVILASNALSEVAMAKGFDVKKNESHGQSQRGEPYQAIYATEKRSFLRLSDGERLTWFWPLKNWRACDLPIF